MSALARHKIAIPMDQLADICRRYQVRELALFGSVVRDDFRDDSDIDVLVEFDPEARFGLPTLFAMQRELEKLFSRQVDLIEKDGLRPRMRQRVLDSREVVYAA